MQDLAVNIKYLKIEHNQGKKKKKKKVAWFKSFTYIQVDLLNQAVKQAV